MASLYKNDFQKIAQIIKNARRQNTAEQALDHVAEDLAHYLKTKNEAFNFTKFLEACE